LIAGKPLEFVWDMSGQVTPGELVLEQSTSTAAAEEDDPYGLRALEAHWRPPALGRMRRTVDFQGLTKGKFAVILADGTDRDYAFTVAGRQLWLGRVS